MIGKMKVTVSAIVKINTEHYKEDGAKTIADCVKLQQKFFDTGVASPLEFLDFSENITVKVEEIKDSAKT